MFLSKYPIKEKSIIYIRPDEVLSIRKNMNKTSTIQYEACDVINETHVAHSVDTVYDAIKHFYNGDELDEISFF